MNALIRPAALLSLLLLTACVTATGQPATETPNEPPPSNWREIIASHVRTSYFDPYTVQDASISNPKAGHMHTGEFMDLQHLSGWIVCVKSNAKNRMGGYTGQSTAAYLIRQGVVAAHHSGDHKYFVREACEGAQYVPFTEIMVMRR